MRVSEVSYSLSGEGVHVGIPTVFVRLAGCNLRCDYCDTQYAQKDGEELELVRVTDKVKEFRLGDCWVLITGGEPLLQEHSVHELIIFLKYDDFSVEIETNGSIDPPPWFREVDCWSVDVKCPSSGPSYGSFTTKWLRKLRKRDQLKFVVGTSEDLNFVKGFLDGTVLRPAILVSPIAGILLDKRQGTIEEYWNREWLQECTEFCKEQNVRMSLQLHKIIYGDKRGV